MKKYFLFFGLLVTVNLMMPGVAKSFYQVNEIQKQNIPVPVIKAANEWAYETGLLPETPPPDYRRAFYTKMSKNSWEVHWVWSIGGITGETRLLISNGGTIISVY